MGYFPNGTAGEAYHAEYCSECIHDQQEGGCPIWFLHGLHNYDECNKPDSFLHILIPRTPDKLGNEACSMFLPSLEDRPSPRTATHCERCGEPYHGGACKPVYTPRDVAQILCDNSPRCDDTCTHTSNEQS